MFYGIQDARINKAMMRNAGSMRDKNITTGAEFALFDGESAGFKVPMK